VSIRWSGRAGGPDGSALFDMRSALRHACVIVAAGAACASGAEERPAAWLPDGVSIAVSAIPTRVTVGDRILYTIRVVVPQGITATPPVFGRTVGEFHIRDLGQLPAVRRKDGSEEISYRYELRLYETGEKSIPPLTVALKSQQGRAAEFDGGAIAVVSESVLDKDAKDIKDIKPPLKLAYIPIAPIVWLCAGVVAAAVALTALRRIRRKSELSKPPLCAPHLIACEELRQLLAMNLIARGRVKEYYIRISGIVRRYIERRFGLRAPDRTTEEFLAEASASGLLDPRARTLVGDFLEECDMVKFARYGPTDEEINGAYAAAKRFVDETAPQG